MRPGQSSRAEHPDLTTPRASLAQISAAYYGQTPPWPPSMIAPSGTELTRWMQLWSRHPRAGCVGGHKQEETVAALVRVQQRCCRHVPSALAEFEVRCLRGELGLD